MDELRVAAAAAARSGDEARACSLLEEAISLANDDDDLGSELRRIPLPSPEQLRLDVRGAKVYVYWSAGQRHTPKTRYVVRRKSTAPVDFRDGDVVHDGLTTEVEDATPPVARATFYSVFAISEAGVASRPVTAEVLVAPPPHSVVSETGADWISFTWQHHPAVESVRVARTVDSRRVELASNGNSLHLQSLVEGEPVTISLLARYRGPQGDFVLSDAVTKVVTPRGQALPIETLQLTNVASSTGCRVRVGWRPVDHSEVTVRVSESPAPWATGAIVTPEQMASHGTEASGSLVTQGMYIGFEATVPEGILHFTPYSTGGTGIVVGRSCSIGTTAPVSNLSGTRFDGFVSLSWSWPAVARVAQVIVASSSVSTTHLVNIDSYQAHGCRLPVTAAAVDIEVRAALPIDDGLSMSSPVRLHVGGDAPRVAYSVVVRRRGSGRLTLRALEQPTKIDVVLVAQAGRSIPFSPDQGTPVLSASVALESDVDHTLDFRPARLASKALLPQGLRRWRSRLASRSVFLQPEGEVTPWHRRLPILFLQNRQYAPRVSVHGTRRQDLCTRR